MKFCSSTIISFNHYKHLKQGKALRYLFSSSRCSKKGIFFVSAMCAILHFVCAMYAILMYASAQHVCAIGFFSAPPLHIFLSYFKNSIFLQEWSCSFGPFPGAQHLRHKIYVCCENFWRLSFKNQTCKYTFSSY